MSDFLHKSVKRYHKLRYYLRGRNKRNVPVFLFTHHKTGTTLLRKVFLDICARERWRFKTVGSRFKTLPHADVILFSHTNIIDPASIGHPYLGVHMIRDPREVVVSGCLYHKRTHEKWCVSKDFEKLNERGGPIPQNKRHCSIAWKKDYLLALDGMSYQERINSLSELDALEFEMRNFSGWTVRDMLEWNYSNPAVLEVKMEDAAHDFSGLFERIFDHLEFTPAQKVAYQELAARHDLNRLQESQVKKIDHVRTTDTCTWPKYFTPQHLALFDELFGSDCCARLGYE